MSRTHLRARRGFSLVELLVAVVIVNVGLLALVSGSAALVRRHAAIHARAAAVRAGAERLARLAVSPCGAASGAEVDANGVTEVWSVGTLDHHTRELADSVVFVAAGASSSIALRTRVLC